MISAGVFRFRAASARWFWPAEFRVVRCAECRAALYATNGRSVRAILPQPVNLTIGNLCVCLCDRRCTLRWLSALAVDELHAGGRRLW